MTSSCLYFCTFWSQESDLLARWVTWEAYTVMIGPRSEERVGLVIGYPPLASPNAERMHRNCVYNFHLRLLALLAAQGHHAADCIVEQYGLPMDHIRLRLAMAHELPISLTLLRRTRSSQPFARSAVLRVLHISLHQKQDIARGVPTVISKPFIHKIGDCRGNTTQMDE